jgi:hypothetical protein
MHRIIFNLSNNLMKSSSEKSQIRYKVINCGCRKIEKDEIFAYCILEYKMIYVKCSVSAY